MTVKIRTRTHVDSIEFRIIQFIDRGYNTYSVESVVKFRLYALQARFAV